MSEETTAPASERVKIDTHNATPKKRGGWSQPIAQSVKQAIVESIKADSTLTISAIAQQHGVSRAAVTAIKRKLEAGQDETSMVLWDRLLRDKIPLHERAKLLAEIAKSKNPAAQVKALQMANEANRLIPKTGEAQSTHALFTLESFTDLEFEPAIPAHDEAIPAKS